ncbi:MAG TPA: aminotransferase class I/II-fold pyridoxal phosphate-dependent enzyme [Bacteroidales bacterium]|nr:aminotransferase class I/II-fold pyridoxal phosphate-dependent enzyme [Bacteroidales bacterium]HPF01639.1 aminotransferase class I/II-fold pyridoxal phosphate-dependent enzyme [Bacteroidales bacterium]HPJ60871.1 aminotransferase class I/II-fold pyridoxal phosphate-dependent enzyme [Bacteroidales bacterium]HPR13305.1 aminotransferase class I/II-fold pyridoxal phosphate-dependent enzyme [Bacteroidales bacterium]HRW85616.1 aminotransferase class I/II-fold pyridoxal phosphate-dependent enzyme [B
MSNDNFEYSPFDSESFRKEGHKIIDLLAGYLKEITNRPSTAVLPWTDPDELAGHYAGSLKKGNQEPFVDYLKEVLERSNHLHHPRYIGHQVTSPLPHVALAQLCTTLLNNGAAVYEMGPVAMAMERNLIRLFSGMIGFDDKADGIFTHGGSAGNLTAMLAIRQVKSAYNVWEEGVLKGQKTGFMVTDQSHYSVSRNVKIMGLGDDALIRVPCDSNYRMRTDLLEQYYEKGLKEGISVAAVVANSCSTATGSYDDLEAIAGFCEKHKLWLHVDGAHGMGVLFSDKYRHLIRGIEKADSVVIDFHKMLLVPGLNTMVVFRDGNRSYETFAQKASYLFKRQAENEWYNSARRTLECTKSSLGFVAFTAFKYYNREYFGNYIDSRYDLAARFTEMIRLRDNFEAAINPDSNIVCFRYNPGGITNEELNRLNAAIRDKIIKDGIFYIVRTELEDKLWLRVTVINPLTTEEDLSMLLDTIETAAAGIQ